MALTGYEKNLSEFTRDELRKIATTYGISLSRIIEDKINKGPLIKLIEENILYKKANPKILQAQQTTGTSSNIPSRMEELKKRIEEEGAQDPEDLMLIIIDVLKEEVLYPEPGKFYTFIYNAKTPNIEYDQHPLIACTSLEKWGFKAINFHWRQGRQYTWQEVAGKLHVVKYNELDEMLSIPYAKFRLNK